MTLPAALHDELRRYVAALDRRYGPDLVSVILFGSRARGEARPESDIDMLIVVRGLPRKRWDRYSGFRDLARQVGEEFSDAVTPVVLTPEEAQEVKPYYLGMLSGQARYVEVPRRGGRGSIEASRPSPRGAGWASVSAASASTPRLDLSGEPRIAG
jgi:predicted nucleotidyltransferase